MQPAVPTHWERLLVDNVQLESCSEAEVYENWEGKVSGAPTTGKVFGWGKWSLGEEEQAINFLAAPEMALAHAPIHAQCADCSVACSTNPLQQGCRGAS